MWNFCTFDLKPTSRAIHWTCINNQHFKKMMRICLKCRIFKTVPSRVLCFHESHQDAIRSHGTPRVHIAEVSILLYRIKTCSFGLNYYGTFEERSSLLNPAPALFVCITIATVPCKCALFITVKVQNRKNFAERGPLQTLRGRGRGVWHRDAGAPCFQIFLASLSRKFAIAMAPIVDRLLH